MRNKPKFVVLGAGNGGLATAADLTIRGFDVNLWEHPDFKENIQPIQESGGITLEVAPKTPLKSGFADLKLVTDNIEEALDGADVILIIVPSFAHEILAELCIPNLQDNQVVIISPGNFGGALQFYNTFKQKGSAKGVIFAETECMIYSCRKKGPTTIYVNGYKKGLRIASFPSSNNDRVMALIQQPYPEVLPGINIIETGLSNCNPISHPPIMILNTGLIDRMKGDFYFYSEGMTESVCKVIETIDRERLAVGVALKTKMRTIFEQHVEWYSHQQYPGANLYESCQVDGAHRRTKAPGTFQDRYLTEDIPYGLAVLEELGRKTGVPTPVTTAIINLSEILVGKNLRMDRRSLEKLRLAQLDVDEIIRFVNEGE
jgi:opine dehydrogenase